MNHNFGKFTLTKVNTSTRFPRISRTHFYRACIQRPIVTFHVGPYLLQKGKIIVGLILPDLRRWISLALVVWYLITK